MPAHFGANDLVCGRLRGLEFQAQDATPTGAPRPFALPGDKPNYAPSRLADIRSIFIDVALDFPNKSVSGTVSTRLVAFNDGLSEMVLDAAEMTIEATSVIAPGATEPHATTFEHSNNKLRIDLGGTHKAGEELTIVVQYRATPRRGLYFIAPDENYPDKQVHCWTQGQDTDNHFWFPCYDFPNHKMTLELQARVPEDFFALSNGALLETTHDAAGKTRSFHWKMALPLPAYLVTLAAGPFVEFKDDYDGIPIQYYVLPGREAETLNAFGKTPAMMKFFSEKLGVRYPYEKYAQVAVSDFIFGGMENTSATTQTDLTLHDDRAHQDFSSDPLVAHELAHQWFGDLITCRDWSHGWLNEGFATYYEALFTEEDKSRDEFIYEMYQNAEGYFGEDSGRYRRPIVCRVYHEPIDLFDRHLYEKGGLVLHMLRYQLGDDLWWKAMHHYLETNKGKNVITPDLERAIEEATGLNMERFFDQWVYKAGFPQFEVGYSYDDKTRTAKVTVKQTQEETTETPLFAVPVDLVFTGEGDQRETFRVEIEEKEHNFYFRLGFKPSFVSFDPDNHILKTLEFQKPKEMLLAELTKDPALMGRIRAAHALAKDGTNDVVTALGAALVNDTAWPAQAEVAAALGTIHANSAMAALLDGLAKVEHPKVRRAIVTALGEFKDDAAAAALQKVLEGDKTDLIEGAAAAALGKTRTGRAFDALQAALPRESFNNVRRIGVFGGLVELKDERAIALALEWIAVGKPTRARAAAINALGALGKLTEGKQKDEVVDRLVRLFDENDFTVRLNAINALKKLGEASALPALQRVIDTALEGREVRLAREAIDALRAKEPSEEVKRLRQDLDRVLSENRDLRDRVESLEGRLDSRLVAAGS